MKRLGLFAILCLSLTQLKAQTIQLTSFATGFNTISDVDFAPGDNRMYVVQQRGRIRLVNTNGTIVGTDFINLTSLVSQTGNERGLLGLAFDPDYITNGYFYVNYTRATNGATRISRFTRNSGNPDIADISSEVVLMEIAQPFTNHNGGCLRFGPDGYLYVGTGDGGSGGDPGNRSQNPNELLGKMLRIDVSNGNQYQIPVSNPYYANQDTLEEIWALGLRNPWRFSFDRLTGDLWIADVGQDAWEEVNFQSHTSQGGENYGWRCYEGNVAYNTAGCQPQGFYDGPVAVYSHAGGSCSVTGGFVYRGAQEGDLYGKFLYVDYCSADFRVTFPDGLGGWTTQSLNSPTNNFVCFGEDHSGELYLADGSNGTVYRLSTTVCQPTASIYGQDGVNAICNGSSLTMSTPAGAGFTYQWMLNGSDIGGATNSSYTASAIGNYQVIVENSGGCRDTSDIFVLTNAITPSVSLAAQDSILCVGQGSIELYGTPSGGFYSGAGVGNGTFFPEVAGAGTHDIIYTYQALISGCIARDTLTVNVDPMPTVSLSGVPNTYCLDDPSITASGSPVGGTLTGPGVTGSLIDPLSAGVGTHQYIYSYTDNNGCSASDTVSVTISDCDVSVENQTGIQQFRMYPNPSSEVVNLEINTVTSMDITVRILSVDGKLISTLSKNITAGSNLIQVDVNGYAKGLYQVQLTGENTWVRPLIVK